MSDIIEGEPPDLHESEITQASKLLMEFYDKYSKRPATQGTLLSLSEEAIERFAKIGLAVAVHTITVPPTIEIVGRTTPYSLERDIAEKKAGAAEEYRRKQRKASKKA